MKKKVELSKYDKHIDSCIRFISLNCAGFHNKGYGFEFAEYLRKSKALFAFLQETHEPAGSNGQKLEGYEWIPKPCPKLNSRGNPKHGLAICIQSEIRHQCHMLSDEVLDNDANTQWMRVRKRHSEYILFCNLYHAIHGLSKADLKEYFKSFSKIVKHVRLQFPDDVIQLIGDWNAHTGQYFSTFGVGEIDDVGKEMIDFVEKNGLHVSEALHRFCSLTRFPVGKQSRKHKPSIIDYIVVGNDKAGHYIAADALCAGGTSDHRMLIYELDGSILTRNISSTPVKRIRKKKLCLFPDLRNDFSVDFKQSKTLNRIKRIEAQGRKHKKPLAEVAAHCSKILGEQLRKSAKKICGETASGGRPQVPNIDDECRRLIEELKMLRNGGASKN